MQEEVIHFIWKYQLFDSLNLYTDDFETVEVLHPGIHNQHAGPDFQQAKIKIGDTIWAGNVEIHVKASDWFAHNHHLDDAYQNVILHVVFLHDLAGKEKTNIPMLVVSEFVRQSVFAGYQQLMNSKLWIPCSDQLHMIPQMNRISLLNRLLINRLENRHQQIIRLVEQNKNDWQESIFQTMARNFGFKVNAYPFEHLAQNTPYKMFSWHKQSLLQIEALLFGQSGLLLKSPEDEYTRQLKKEYHFLRTKYNLKGIDEVEWKFGRLRPSNFPTIRISQFASLLFNSSNLFSKIMETENLESMMDWFKVEASWYWSEHYQFGVFSNKKLLKKLGQSSINNIFINTVIPYIFAYGKEKNRPELTDRAIDFIEKLPSEKNSILTAWENLNFRNTHAGESQALLELKKEYCDKKRCLECSIGTQILCKN